MKKLTADYIRDCQATLLDILINTDDKKTKILAVELCKSYEELKKYV